MWIIAFPIYRVRRQFLRTLHLFYAGLFALVLPFICWGAQGTPGHPHDRAHFVFVDPVLSTHIDTGVGKSISAPQHVDIQHNAHAMAHTSPQPPKSQPKPAGRSAPSMLGITLLLLVGIYASLLPLNVEGPGFYYWFAPPNAPPFSLSIPTPPPR